MTPPKDTKKSKIKKKVNYTEEDLKRALNEIRTNEKGIRETAKAFGIPYSTLQERLCGKRGDAVCTRGPDPVLGAEGEKSVKNWLISIAKCGFPVKKEELLDTVQKIVKDCGTKNPFTNDRPGQTWYRNFLKRHPDLSLRAAEGINKARARVTEESIRAWFDELKIFLTETNNQEILECPERIFNGDESGFSMCPKTGKVLAPKGYRNLLQIKSGNEKENLTVLVTFNANGQICPPLVVFPYVRPPRAVVESMPEDWCLGKSESGWMRADVFFEYITNDFHNWVVRNEIKKPILLLVDGHRSHMSLVLSAMCENLGIILYALPPNTTHMLQPADVSVFAPLKASWKTIVRKFLSKPENVNSCVTKTNFCKLFQERLEDTNMEKNIKNGFKKCGLYPFSPDAVDYTKCVQNTLENVQRRAISDNSNEICNEDLISTRKVLKHLRPVLKQKKINVSAILKEVRKLKKPETSSVSTEIESEEDITGSFNLSSSLQMECSADGVHLTDPTTRPLNAIDVLPSQQLSAVTDIQILQPLLDEVQEEKDNIGVQTNNSATTVITTADIHTEPSPGLTKDDYVIEDIKVTHGERVITEDSAEQMDIVKDIKNSQIIFEKKNKPLSPAQTALDEILPYPQETEEERKIDDNVSLSTLHLSGTGVSSFLDVGSLVSLDDVIVIPTQVNTPISDSDAFSKHLFIPEPPERAKPKQVRTPSAISSSAWRKFYEDKENVKVQKQEATRKRQLERSEKLKQNKKKKDQMPKTKGKKDKKKKDQILKELCAQCEDILISDTEEEEEKNVGCDHCPRWYHLKCTVFAGSLYNDVKDKNYRCHACIADQD